MTDIINSDDIYNNRPKRGRPKKIKVYMNIGRPTKYKTEEERATAKKEATKRYKEKNKEAINNYSKQYYCDNKEQMKKSIYISKYKKRISDTK